jgi:hypothetical protein
MDLIACDPLVGLPRLPLEGLYPDKADLLCEMKRLGITKAIIRHRHTIDCGAIAGNISVNQTIKDEQSLLGCWCLNPEGFEPNYCIPEMVQQMLVAGVKTAWIDPENKQYSLMPWCCGGLYEELAAHNIPLFLSVFNKDNQFFDSLDIALGEFPKLKIIFMNTVRHIGRDRMLYQLFKRHENAYMCLGPTFNVRFGIESLCENFGFHRWVFGMGYPDSEGGASIAGLMYSDLSDLQKQAIASENILRILSEVT